MDEAECRTQGSKREVFRVVVVVVDAVVAVAVSSSTYCIFYCG